MASSTNPTDEGADEIKIFRRSDTDDADSAQPSHQLTEDKKAVAYETELETSKCTPSSSASSIGNRDGSMAFIISAGSKSGAFKPTAASGMSPGAYSNLQHLWLANMQPFFWNYHNGQSYALPPYASSFLSGRPMQQQSSTGPPPAHNGSATTAGGFNMLSLDPTSVKSTASPTYPSPYYHPYAAGAALSPSFVDLCSRLQMAHSPASPLSPAAMMGHHQHQSLKPSDFMQLKSPANNSLGIPLAPSVQQMMRFAAVSSSANNPLNSINQMRLPNMTTPITSMANSLATAQQHHHNNHTSSNSKTHHNGRQRASHGSGNNRTTTGSTVKKDDGEKHIKKPLNAFMWFMKENRPKLMEEQNYKERQSAELNKELGRRWHNLAQDEQQKYYAMAREERAKHMALHPGWTARDNYAINKKKKRKRDKSLDNSEMKKCRARFGLEHQHEWCKHCKRKKRCLWSNRENSKLSPEELSPPAQVSSTTQGSPAAVMTPSPFSASMHPHSIGSVLKLSSSHGYNAERLAAAAAVVGLIAPPPPPSAPTAAVGASEQSNNNNKSAATPHHSNGTAFVTSSTTRSPRRSHLVGAVGHPSDNDDDDVDDDDDEEEDEDDESDCGVDGVDPREAAEALAMAID